jgi:hypothetical protein
LLENVVSAISQTFLRRAKPFRQALQLFEDILGDEEPRAQCIIEPPIIDAIDEATKNKPN